MISLVAPCLNEAENLPLFLSSLRKQTFQDFQVVIVDGGSTDDTLTILNEAAKRLDLKTVVSTTRNFGFIRNIGFRACEGGLIFQTSVDTYLEPDLLDKIERYFFAHPECVSLAGRTYPLGTSVFAHLSYQVFDFLRFLFTCLPSSVRKYRPSGNFTVFRSGVFEKVGGYPHVTVNEDGLMGQKLDAYARLNKKSVMFHLGLWVGHRVKKFEDIGGVKAILFYLYTLSNLFPMLKPLLAPVERRAGLVFEGKLEL